MASRKVMLTVVMAVVLVSMAPTLEAQTPPAASCIQALIPCQAYINSTARPPATCCGPLRQAFETQLSCLCEIFKNPSIAAATNVNMTQAMELPAKCGISAASNPNICNKGQGASPVSSPTPAPEAGGRRPTTSSPGTSAASNIAWAGPVSSMMLLLAGLMFY